MNLLERIAENYTQVADRAFKGRYAYGFFSLKDQCRQPHVQYSHSGVIFQHCLHGNHLLRRAGLLYPVANSRRQGSVAKNRAFHMESHTRHRTPRQNKSQGSNGLVPERDHQTGFHGASAQGASLLGVPRCRIKAERGHQSPFLQFQHVCICSFQSSRSY